MKLSDFLNKRCPVAVPFGDQTLNLVYKPGVYTPKFESETREAASSEDADFLSEWLSPLIESWDLIDDANVPVPLDKASLRSLPIGILTGCSRAIIENLSPNRSASASSANT